MHVNIQKKKPLVKTRKVSQILIQGDRDIFYINVNQSFTWPKSWNFLAQSPDKETPDFRLLQ